MAGPRATIRVPVPVALSPVGAALPAPIAARVRRPAASEVQSRAAALCQTAAFASSPAPSPLAWIHGVRLQPSVARTRRHQHAGAR